MRYTTQQWTAPQGTGLNRYAKGTETETHITLTLDPENLTNSPTPFTAERMAHIESGIADAYAIEKLYPIEWRENALGQANRFWSGMTTLGTDVYACVYNGNIYKQTGGTGDFISLGQTTRNWNSMTTLGNDVYACVQLGDIYKQTGGTGDFVALGQTSGAWSGMTTLGTDVYACVYGGNIYKQTGGTGNFISLGQTSRNWNSMTTLGNDVYACVNGGDIYKQTGGTGDFVALNQTNRFWYGMTTLGTNVYACVYNGDIYKQTGGTGDFIALGQTLRSWNSMTTLGNDVYACVQLGDIYKLSLSNTIRASADFTLSAYPDGSRKRIANTHATNTITVTLPSGITYAGAITSFTLKPYEKIEIELFGTEWDEIGNEGIGTITATGSTTADFGRLLCHGQELSRTTYARLFNRIGTAFGVGDGSKTFNLPDFREVALVGAGTNVLNASAIRAHDTYTVGQFKDDAYETHGHGIQRDDGGSYAECVSVPSGRTDSWRTATGFSTLQNGRGTVTRGKRIGVNYQIKY